MTEETELRLPYYCEEVYVSASGVVLLAADLLERAGSAVGVQRFPRVVAHIRAVPRQEDRRRRRRRQSHCRQIQGQFTLPFPSLLYAVRGLRSFEPMECPKLHFGWFKSALHDADTDTDTDFLTLTHPTCMIS